MFKVYYNDLEVLIHYSFNKESAWVYCHNKKEYDIEPSFKFKVKDKPTIDNIIKEVDKRIDETNNNVNIITRNLVKRNIIYYNRDYSSTSNDYDYSEYNINNKFILVFDGNIISKYTEIYNNGSFFKFMITFKDDSINNYISEFEETMVNRLKIYKNIEINYI